MDMWYTCLYIIFCWVNNRTITEVCITTKNSSPFTNVILSAAHSTDQIHLTIVRLRTSSQISRHQIWWVPDLDHSKWQSQLKRFSSEVFNYFLLPLISIQVLKYSIQSGILLKPYLHHIVCQEKWHTEYPYSGPGNQILGFRCF